MNLEKRSDTAPEEPAEPHTSSGKKPVIVYIMILFIVAFLLMALSFVMHQRSNTEALGELQDSMSALQEVQATQDRNIKLQEELSAAQADISALKEESKQQDADLAASQAANDALLSLYTLQQQYAADDYDGCLKTMQTMEDNKEVDLLPKEVASGVTSPAQRYQQLKEAVLNK